ncbi:MAG TPA: hypothetical protein PLW67_05135 [Prolixibacteraceae bacterium]|nr:hypothetical protein [Prolixibacteraceae bacterium]
MKERKYIYSATVLIALLLVAAGCERNVDELELATYPVTPEVFIDGFSSGLYYSAYGTSKVTAFSVDNEVKYKGTSSMKFEVPDADDPNGSYVGGVFGTNPGRDLSGYNVLTFWAKASQPATLNEVGFGNDMGESKYQVTLSNVALNSNWMKFYVPFPDPSVLKQERGMFFYGASPKDGKGYTFWIDEVQFEKLGTIAHPTAGIFNGQEVVKDKAESGETFPIADLYASFNLPTGIDQKVGLSKSYFTFTSSNPSVATVNDSAVSRVVSSGSAVITAKVGNISASGSLKINSIGQPVGPAEPARTPTVDSKNVISLYSNAYTNVPVDTWNTHWQYSTAENQFIKIQQNDVIRYRNLNFVGIEFSSQPVNAGSMTYFHMDIWTPDVTTSKVFKIMLVDFGANGVYGGNDDSSHEYSVTSPELSTQKWISLDIPLSRFTGLTGKSHLGQMVLSGDLPNVYVDNVYFYNFGTTPTAAAPVPTTSAANVISVFSDAYTNATGTDFNPNWGQATLVTQVPVAGNNTLKLAGLNYQGIQLGSNQNVSGMGFLHLDVWSATSTLLNVFLISPGPVEKPYSIPVPTAGWTSMDIPLSAFSPVDLANVFQFKFDGNGDIFMDNIYFYRTGGAPLTEPAAAAPAPTASQANVISVFSDAYTNISGTDMNPNWGQSTVVSQVPIAGNSTLKYTGLNYQGIQLGSNQNVSGMGYLHLDIWSANSTSLNVSVISPGPAEKAYKITVPTTGWTSLNIPLSSFSGVDLTNVMQLKFDGNGNIWIDNIYFYKSQSGGAYSLSNPIDFESSGFGAGWTWNVFENAAGPALEFVANPDKTGANTSATVARFKALATGQPWAGCEVKHGAMGTFKLDASNCIVRIMVYKTVKSDVGIKFAKSDGWSMGEIKVANTVINAWQELTFNFTAQVQDGYDQIVIFPDFNARTSDNVVYFDNITFGK